MKYRPAAARTANTTAHTRHRRTAAHTPHKAPGTQPQPRAPHPPYMRALAAVLNVFTLKPPKRVPGSLLKYTGAHGR